jgi:hypothetical protein
MIGRRNFTALSSKHAIRMFRAFSLSVGDDSLQATDADGYIEPMLTSLGALHISAVVYSPFEGASVIHDMNVPISGELKGIVERSNMFSTIPKHQKRGGDGLPGRTLSCYYPLQQQYGHGFYQGFTVEHMFICQWGQGPWYRVLDPSAIGQRVELINDHATYLLIQAARVRKTNIFAAAPQQSDYVTKWNGETPSPPVHS